MTRFIKNVSVVWQMRIAGAMVLVSVLMLLFLGVSGLRLIGDSQSRLTDNAIPSLARVDAFDTRLRRIGTAIAAQRNAEVGTALDTLNGQIGQLIRGLEVLAAGDEALTPQVAQLSTAAAAVAEESRNRFQLWTRLRQLLDRIQTIETSIQKQASLSLVENGTRIEMLILGNDPEGFVSQMHDSIVQSIALTNLTLLLENNGDLLNALGDPDNPIARQQAESQLQFNYRAVVRFLLDLPDTPERREIAASVNRSRELMWATDGLFAVLQEFAESDERFEALVAVEEQQLEQVASRVNAGVANAKLGITEATTVVEATVAKMTQQFKLVGIAVCVLIVLTGYLLLERRVIRRLSSLSGAVRDIAAGDTDRDVPFVGNDELGEMASALEQFKANSKELHRSNAELARFAYAASHDLRSPLRAIHNLAQWTLEDYEDVLPDDGRENLEVLQSRAQRLTTLLDDMLSYSQIGRELDHYETVELSTMIDNIIDLQGIGEAFDIEVRGNAMRFDTYHTPFQQVCLNLISNAIKHHDREHGKIVVDCNWQDDGLSVAITDDGPGIPEEYHDRIFGMFETLRPRDEIEGSGMGLAIIRKLVERFDGRVDVVSDPAKRRGTTFRFNWPATQPGEAMTDHVRRAQDAEI